MHRELSGKICEAGTLVADPLLCVTVVIGMVAVAERTGHHCQDVILAWDSADVPFVMVGEQCGGQME